MSQSDRLKAQFPVLGRVPKALLPVLIIAVSLGWGFVAYGQRTSISFSTIWEGNVMYDNGNVSFGQMVINDNKTFSEMWTQHFCCQRLPQINFTSKTVLAEFYDSGSPGKTVEIFRVSQVELIDPHIQVDMKKVTYDCMHNQIAVYWFHIVVIDKTLLPVRFAIAETLSEPCPGPS